MPATFTQKLFGRRFGRLIARRYVKGSKWECICDCGTIVIVDTAKLTTGHTKSCGCLQVDRAAEANTTHGQARARLRSVTSTYRTWQQMKRRCFNPANHNYKYYGGRGVVVCDRWRESFEAFLEDMGERPSGHTIDRINSDGNYEPGNCRWATPTEQRRNRRDYGKR